MTPRPRIRDAFAGDAAACAAIYAPYVSETAISFETVPPSAPEMLERMADAMRGHAWLVVEIDGRIVGYAYAHEFAPRAAYRWSCETSIYLDGERRRVGLGRLLYTALLDRLVERGYRLALAGVTLPNDASTGFHQAMGYEPAGVYRRVGWKHGAWHDVAWFQRAIGPGGDAPPSELS